jgi:S-formylglutathione hydrolase FrmB
MKRLIPLAVLATTMLSATQFSVSFPKERSDRPLDGRLLLLLSTDPAEEPRLQISGSVKTQIVFGTDVDDWKPGAAAKVGESAQGYPIRKLSELKPGEYTVQALLNRYETFHLADGRVVKLPPDRGEGQQWQKKPGNLYSKPVKVTIGAGGEPVALTLDQEIPPIVPAQDTKYIKHIRIRSERLSKFYGTDMYLGAHVLLPEGFDEHPEAHYPLLIDQGHFPADFDEIRTEPPDPNLKPEDSERFHIAGYNKVVQQELYDVFKKWTSPGFPRMLVVEIQHATPYYDDSYAVNSANVGPYGDAIMYELIPEIERRFRGIGQGWARFTYGGSTGGWEALAVQIFYPDEFNGAFGACPDPIDFRAYTVIDIYNDKNAYYVEGPHTKVERPAARNYLGHISGTVASDNMLELALGTKTRSGGQWDIWEAVFSPAGPDGYPARLWNKETGEIDHNVAEAWKKYDLRYQLETNWAKLGPKLRGKLHIYVGEADTYYLNNAVYLMEDFLKQATNPPAEAEVAYGNRFEHCWNGDPNLPNAISRLHYTTIYVPKIVERIEKSAPVGADLKSWRY